MAAYLTPALLAVLIALVGWIGRQGLALIRAQGRQMEELLHCHLERHPADLARFKLGGPA